MFLFVFLFCFHFSVFFQFFWVFFPNGKDGKFSFFFLFSEIREETEKMESLLSFFVPVTLWTRLVSDSLQGCICRGYDSTTRRTTAILHTNVAAFLGTKKNQKTNKEREKKERRKKTREQRTRKGKKKKKQNGRKKRQRIASVRKTIEKEWKGRTRTKETTRNEKGKGEIATRTERSFSYNFELRWIWCHVKKEDIQYIPESYKYKMK